MVVFVADIDDWIGAFSMEWFFVVKCHIDARQIRKEKAAFIIHQTEWLIDMSPMMPKEGETSETSLAILKDSKCRFGGK